MQILLILLLSSIAISLDENYRHLDIEWARQESYAVALKSRAALLRKTKNNREAMEIFLGKRLRAEKEGGLKGDKWKQIYENDWVDHVDRALIAQSVCRIRFGEIEECNVGIEWDNKYDTRDPELVAEFRSSIGKVMQAAVDQANKGKGDL